MNVILAAWLVGSSLGVAVGYALARWAWTTASGETNRRPR